MSTAFFFFQLSYHHLMSFWILIKILYVCMHMCGYIGNIYVCKYMHTCILTLGGGGVCLCACFL